MLVMTPAARKLLRAERRRERDAIRGRMGEDRHRALVLKVTSIIRTELAEGRIATPFGLEGPMRHAIRGKLCLQGWAWADADEAAKLVLSESFVMIRAERPAWKEGQPEWVTHGGELIERSRCARCGTPLPESDVISRRKYCGTICRRSHNDHLNRLRAADADKAVGLVVKFGGSR